MRRLATASAACIAVAVLLGAVKPCYQERNMTLLLAPAVAGVAWMVSSRHAAVSLAGVAVASMVVAASFGAYGGGHGMGDYRSAVDSVRGWPRPSTVIFYPDYARLPWEHYAGPVPRWVGVHRNAPAAPAVDLGRTVLLVATIKNGALKIDRQMVASGYRRGPVIPGLPTVVLYELVVGDE